MAIVLRGLDDWQGHIQSFWEVQITQSKQITYNLACRRRDVQIEMQQIKDSLDIVVRRWVPCEAVALANVAFMIPLSV